MSELKEKASYCVGVNIGQSLENQNLGELDLNQIAKGIQDVFDKNNIQFTPQEANSFIQSYLDQVNASKFEQFKTEGEAFLSQNKTKDGITTLTSGLQYEVVSAGSGRKPGPTSQVTVHYHGTLIDGTVFDSSIQRGTPATFGVNQVIPGWTEALQLMEEGAKWRLYIPQHLAYGANPHPGGPIKPFMALIFDVELITVQ